MKARAQAVLACLSLIALLSGCEANTHPRAVPGLDPNAAQSVPAALSPSASPSPSRAVPCQQPGRVYSDTVEGRRVIVRIPNAPSHLAGMHRVILALHGYSGEAQDFLRYTSLDGESRYSQVVLAPQGLPSPSGGAGWNFGRTPAYPADDVAFLDRLLDHYSGSLCLDLTRVAVAGWSDGADMAVTYSCHSTHTIEHMWAVAAAYAPNATCPHVRNVHLIHGKRDPIEPYEGGSQDNRAGVPHQRSQSAVQMLDQWARVQGCEKPVAYPGTHEPGTHLDVAARCTTGATVGLLSFDEGGHPWPGATYEIDAKYGPRVDYRLTDAIFGSGG